MKLLQDIYIEELFSSLKEKARKVHEQEFQQDIEDLEVQLRFWFSKQYNIPMKSPVLDAYTLPDMLLEFYLHTYKPPTTEDLIKETRSELGDMIAKEFSDEENAFMDDVFGKENSWEFKE